MSLKNLARIIANCPEKHPNLCVDDITHPSDPYYLDTLKTMIPLGTYDMKGYDSNKNAELRGTLDVSYGEKSIHFDVQFKFPIISEDEVIRREGKVSADSTGKAVYSTMTTKSGFAPFKATKQMKCVSKDVDSVTFVGYGSSTSTGKYHCGTNVKKIFTSTGPNSFRVETYLDDKPAYRFDYQRKVM